MKKQLFHMQEVPPGSFVGFSEAEGVHKFDFDNGLSLEAYAAWRLVEPGFEARTIFGRRDIANKKNPTLLLSSHLLSYKLVVLVLDSVEDRFMACFESKDGEQLRLEIFKDSSTEINWKISGEDFQDADHPNLICDQGGDLARDSSWCRNASIPEDSGKPSGGAS